MVFWFIVRSSGGSRSVWERSFRRSTISRLRKRRSSSPSCLIASTAETYRKLLAIALDFAGAEREELPAFPAMEWEETGE